MAQVSPNTQVTNPPRKGHPSAGFSGTDEASRLKRKQTSQSPMSTSALAAPPAPKQLVPIGNRGIVPSNMDDLFRFAKAVAVSGLAPKGIETPEAIFVALEIGLEVGLPMMAALQNIAVINGRPAIWGDAQLAVVRSTGELVLFEEWYEEKGKRLPRNPSAFTDDTAAVCRVQRSGYEPAETAFTVADAKRANLWSKAGPWTQYPARMLKHRARSFALRDQFGDALRGLRTVEEAQDDPVSTARNVTPSAPLFQAPQVSALEAASFDPGDPPSDQAGESAPTQPDPDPAASSGAPPKTDLDAKRELIGDGFKAAGVSFDNFVGWIAFARQVAVKADGFADLEEPVVRKLMPNLPALIKQAKAWVDGGAK